MSISDRIVVMKDGVVQQIGKPQDVYDSPVNLFVAKFLGTPPINVFEGTVRQEMLSIGEDAVLPVPGIPEGDVTVGIRPEGFIPDENGPLHCTLSRVEVMGRDVSIVSTNAHSLNPNIRSIIDAGQRLSEDTEIVHFSLKPRKVFLFDKETGERKLCADDAGRNGD